ncbi:DUF4326 domain-containing protein [Roseomonas sp. USHLN139]|uniref:DUF4326 domain-containing protein n=1 Tax=Roseomonas sp. USHLN139 TaxID=3081298 RepID=UPI003B0148A2
MGDRPQRVQLRRLKGWRMPANTVKVCRPGPWGNPFKIGVDAVHSAAFAKELYADWIMRPTQDTLRQRLPTLRGKNLACWCRLDQPCHADVLLLMANSSPP